MSSEEERFFCTLDQCKYSPWEKLFFTGFFKQNLYLWKIGLLNKEEQVKQKKSGSLLQRMLQVHSQIWKLIRDEVYMACIPKGNYWY